MDAITEASVVTQFQNRDRTLEEIDQKNLESSKVNLTPDYWKA